MSKQIIRNGQNFPIGEIITESNGNARGILYGRGQIGLYFKGQDMTLENGRPFARGNQLAALIFKSAQ